MLSSTNREGHLLERLRQEFSLDLIGVADVREGSKYFQGIPDELVQTLPRAIVIALRVSQTVLATLHDGPNLLYYHHYRQINALLDRAATGISAEIEKRGYSGLPIPASQIVDWDKMTGHLSHRAIAHLAGLGWIGRNNLLVTPEFGSQVRLATILTDLPLMPTPSMETRRADCGTCFACLAICPAKAIGEDPKAFNHEACYRQLKEFSRARRIGQYICGLCVKACAGSANTAPGRAMAANGEH